MVCSDCTNYSTVFRPEASECLHRSMMADHARFFRSTQYRTLDVVDGTARLGRHLREVREGARKCDRFCWSVKNATSLLDACSAFKGKLTRGWDRRKLSCTNYIPDVPLLAAEYGSTGYVMQDYDIRITKARGVLSLPPFLFKTQLPALPASSTAPTRCVADPFFILFDRTSKRYTAGARVGSASTLTMRYRWRNVRWRRAPSARTRALPPNTRTSLSCSIWRKTLTSRWV